MSAQVITQAATILKLLCPSVETLLGKTTYQ